MAIEKIIDLNVNAQPAEEATKSLKAQLREAQNEVAKLSDKFGATSKEATEAAKRAAELADKIGDAKALTDAFNPDAKFKSLTASLSGVASGFAAVQGAMGLFGTESKEVEATLLKVQSAMALASGLQAVGESVDSFKQLGAVVQSFSVVQKISTAAQWLWNAAMAANPIGAILTAIVAVIVAGYKLIKFFMDSAEANEAAMEATQRNTQALKQQQEQFAKTAKTLSEHNKFQYDMAKASGASSEALRKLALANAKEEEALAKKNTILARATFLRERDTLATLRSNGASEEAIAAQEKLTDETWKEFSKQRENYYKQKDAVVSIQRQQAVEIRQEQTNAHKKQMEDDEKRAQEARDKAEERHKKDLEDRKRRNDEIKAQLEKDAQDAIKYRYEQYEIYKKEQEQKRADEEAFRQAELEEDEFQQQKQIEIAEKLKQFREETEKAKWSLAEQGVGFLKQIGEKNKAIQRVALVAENAVAIARIIQNTQVANLKAVALSPATGGQPWVGINTVSAGLSIASTILATSKALKELGGGGSSGGGSSAGSTSGGSGSGGATAPAFNIVGDANQNAVAGAISQKNQTPVQAYVVAQNVSSAQSLNRNIVQSATLG